VKPEERRASTTGTPRFPDAYISSAGLAMHEIASWEDACTPVTATFLMEDIDRLSLMSVGKTIGTWNTGHFILRAERNVYVVLVVAMEG